MSRPFLSPRRDNNNYPDDFVLRSPDGVSTIGESLDSRSGSQRTGGNNSNNASAATLSSATGQRALNARQNKPKIYVLSRDDLADAEKAKVGTIGELFSLAKGNALKLETFVGKETTHQVAKKAFLQDILDKERLGTPKARDEVAFKLQELDHGLDDVYSVADIVKEQAEKKMADHQPNLNVANAFLFGNHNVSYKAAETFVLLVHYVRNGFSGDDFDERFLGDPDMMAWIVLKVIERIASLTDLCDKLKMTEDIIKTFPHGMALAILTSFHHGKLFAHHDYQRHVTTLKHQNVLCPAYPTDKIPTYTRLKVSQMHAALFVCFGFTPTYKPGYGLFDAKVGAANDGWVREPKLVSLDAIRSECLIEYNKDEPDLEVLINEWIDTTHAPNIQAVVEEHVPKHFGALNQIVEPLRSECLAVRDNHYDEIRNALHAAARDPALINSLLAAHNKRASDRATPASPDASL